MNEHKKSDKINQCSRHFSADWTRIQFTAQYVSAIRRGIVRLRIIEAGNTARDRVTVRRMTDWDPISLSLVVNPGTLQVTVGHWHQTDTL